MWHRVLDTVEHEPGGHGAAREPMSAPDRRACGDVHGDDHGHYSAV